MTRLSLVPLAPRCCRSSSLTMAGVINAWMNDPRAQQSISECGRTYGTIPICWRIDSLATCTRSSRLSGTRSLRPFGISPHRFQSRNAFASLGSVQTDPKVVLLSHLWDRSTPIPKPKCCRFFGIGPLIPKSECFRLFGIGHIDSKVSCSKISRVSCMGSSL